MFPTDLLPKALASAGYVFPATWGLKTMISTEPDLLLFIPLIAFFVVAVIISCYKLAKIGID